jgi:sporulation protein YlmC with PRC-barrel domain
MTQMERIQQNPGNTTGTDARPGAAAGTGNPSARGAADRATGATTAGIGVDSARLQGGQRASKLIGQNIYNEANESVGEVDDLIVPQGGAGQPVVVLSVGGFLGIGARLVAVPYERLQWNAERERWTLPGATKDSLESLPAYDHDNGNRRG